MITKKLILVAEELILITEKLILVTEKLILIADSDYLSIIAEIQTNWRVEAQD